MASNTLTNASAGEFEKARKSWARLQAAASVLQRTDSILLSDRVAVNLYEPQPGYTGMQHNPDVPGFTDGEAIYLNAARLKVIMETDPSWLITAMGLNYHELAHLLYSPMDPDLLDHIADPGLKALHWHTLNVLEDQRIETMFWTIYEPVEMYFTKVILAFLLGDSGARSRKKQNPAEIYPLIIGRLYLSPDFREVTKQSAVDAGFDAADADRLEVLVKEYLGVVWPTDKARALQIVDEVLRILRRNLPEVPQTPESNFGQEGGQSTKTPDANAQREAVAAISDVLSAESGGDDDADAGSGDGDDDTDDEDGAGETGDGDQDADDSGDDEESEDEGEDDGDVVAPKDKQRTKTTHQSSDTSSSEVTDSPVAGNGAGTGAGNHDVALDPSDFARMLKDSLIDLEEAGEFQEALDDLARSVRSVIAQGKGVEFGRSSTAEIGLDPTTLALFNHVKRKLAALRVAAEGERVPNEVGDINIERYEAFRQGQSFDVDFFDVIEDDHYDETVIEAVLLLDISGSMGGWETELANASWLWKRAVEKLGGRCAVLAFDTSTYEVYAREAKTKPGVARAINTLGGTDPTEALASAAHILESAPRNAIRIVVILTDGGWWGGENAERVIKTMNRQGVITTLYGMDGAVDSFGDHGCSVSLDIDEPADIVRLTEKVVAKSMVQKINSGA